jgi:hypothetical protein
MPFENLKKIGYNNIGWNMVLFLSSKKNKKEREKRR